jgi:hypothetical protein
MMGEAKLKMPPPENATVKFCDQAKTLLLPYFLVLDTESILVTEHAGPSNAYKKHEMSEFALAIVRSHDKQVVKFYKYHGPNAPKLLVDTLEHALKFIEQNLLNTPIVMTDCDEDNFNRATKCHHCQCLFDDTIEKKNADIIVMRVESM